MSVIGQLREFRPWLRKEFRALYRSAKHASYKPHTWDYVTKFKIGFGGVRYALNTQPSFVIQTVVGIIIVIAGLLFRLNYIEWAIILGTMSLTFVAEAINTAIEQVAKIEHKTYNPLVKRALDVSSGAVLLSAFFNVCIGAIIFGHHIIEAMAS